MDTLSLPFKGRDGVGMGSNDGRTEVTPFRHTP